MIHARKIGAAKQVFDSGDKGINQTRAVIDEHGYTVSITVTLNYNALGDRRIPFAHKQVRDTIDSAIETANNLRGYSPALFDLEDLPGAAIDMDRNHS